MGTDTQTVWSLPADGRRKDGHHIDHTFQADVYRGRKSTDHRAKAGRRIDMAG